MSNSAPITTLGGILEALLAHEKARIASFEADGFNIPHGPTIGNMYEGLTSKLLSEAIPKNLNLRVTNGFVSGKDGSMSGQIDCMLVSGCGKQIPNTDHEIVPVENVLVVLEVKKTLYGGSFVDILDHFRQLTRLEPNLAGMQNARSIFRIFSQITGVHLESVEEIEFQSFQNQQIYHSIVIERFRPVRIAIGYDGFKTESGLRESFLSHMQKNLGKRWIAPVNWPELVISGDFSMVKLNGRPYLCPANGDFWDLFATTRSKPVQLLLEFIYTRISQDVSLVDFWGDDLEQEVLNRFLQARAREQGELRGWEWNYINSDEKQLSQTPLVQPWEPYFPDDEEMVVFHLLMQSPDGLEIAQIEEGIGEKAMPLVKKIISSGLVARSGNKLFLTTIQAIAGFYKGKNFVGENNTGRLTSWSLKSIKPTPNGPII